MAGLVPAISIQMARRCPDNRDDRDKPGHDATEEYKIRFPDAVQREAVHR
jgi:hypothetical protein